MAATHMVYWCKACHNFISEPVLEDQMRTFSLTSGIQLVNDAIPVEVGMPGRSQQRYFVAGAGKIEWFKDHDVGPEMVIMPAGSIVMGAS